MEKQIIYMLSLIAAVFALTGCGGYAHGKLETAELIPPNATVGILYSPLLTHKDPAKATLEESAAIRNANAVFNAKNTIPYAVFKHLAQLHPGGKLSLVSWNSQQNMDYILEITGDTTCPSPSEAAIKGAAGILVTGATFAFAPLGVAVTPMTHVNAYVTTYKKDKTTQVGKGLIVSSGSSVIVDCEIMMLKVATLLHDKQFAPIPTVEK